MLLANAISGNLHASKRVAGMWRRAESSGAAERLFMTRTDMDKVRIRRKTDKGTDIGIVLERWIRLRHGDVLDVGGKVILIEQMPEQVISVFVRKASAAKTAKAAFLAGHAIGNRHRPIAVGKGKVSFPIQDPSELHLFQSLMPKGVKLKVSREIFVPSGEVHHHE